VLLSRSAITFKCMLIHLFTVGIPMVPAVAKMKQEHINSVGCVQCSANDIAVSSSCIIFLYRYVIYGSSFLVRVPFEEHLLAADMQAVCVCSMIVASQHVNEQLGQAQLAPFLGNI
jgi:hypothetical protein